MLVRVVFPSMCYLYVSLHGVEFCVRSALKEEKIAARSAILPMLQAEEDERYLIDNVCHFHSSLSSTEDMRSLILVQICQRMEEVS